MLASLEIWDFLWILMVMGAAGGSAAYYKFKPADSLRLLRLEEKVDLLLKSFNLEYQPSTENGLSAEVMVLADDPDTRLRAIHLYQKQTGAGFTEARVTIEDYIAGRG